MASIYEQVMGTAFRQLHPRIQQRFGFSSEEKIASIGRGTMHRVWHSKLAVLPLLVGTARHIMFPDSGREIPFMIENYAYCDSYGRETVTWNRTFRFPRKLRRFDATMICSQSRQCIVDYLGSKQHLAVDLELSAAENGGLRIRSGEQRFYEGLLGFRFPAVLTGTADVCEWYDDEEQHYRIAVEVNNKIIGTVFKYEGSFQAQFLAVKEMPPGIRPLREEWRE